MPIARYLALPLATAALLVGANAHAEARRSGQSMPVIIRYSVPAPAPERVAATSHSSRDDGSRSSLARMSQSVRSEQSRPSVSDRSDSARNDSHRFDGRHFDNRRYDDDRGREAYEEAKEHEGHHFGHHGHGDSYGC